MRIVVSCGSQPHILWDRSQYIISCVPPWAMPRYCRWLIASEMCEYIWNWESLSPSWCLYITTAGKECTQGKGRKERCNISWQSHALELCGMIYHFFHLPCSIFFFYINGNLQALFCKDRYKYDLSFLRVGRTPHNGQHHACTYRSEQVGICLLLRCFFFLLQINSCAFVNSQQWKKCGVFTIPYGCGYWNAGESTK